MAITLPTEANVARAGLRSDPGLNIPVSAAGEGLAAVGQAATEVADTLVAADARVRNRQDTVDRARSVREFNALVNEEFRRIETEEDLSTRETTTNFGAFLQENRDRFVSEHAGSDDSRADLGVRLDSISASISDSAAVKSVTAQRALVSDALSQDLSDAAIRVQENPGSVFDELKAFDDSIIAMSAALTPDEQRDRTLAGQAVIVTNATDTMMSQGNIEGAKALLETPGIAEVVGETSMLKFNTRVAKIERDLELEARKAEVEASNTLRIAEMVKGAPLTPQERLDLAGLVPKSGPQTLQQKVAGIEVVIGRPLTQSELENAADIGSGGDRGFGKGIQGQALQTVTDLAPAFSDGLLTPEDERQFMSSISVLSQPIQFTNPDTGLLETRTFPLPAFAVNALNQRGLGISATDGQRPQVGITPEAPSELPADAAAIAVEDDPLQGLPTIFETAEQATGVGPATGEFLGGLPIIGGVFDADAVTQISRRLELATNNLINVLRRNPRFSEGEREALKEDFSVGGGFFDNPRAFQNRIKGIDDGLKIRLKEAQTILDSPITTKEERTVAIREQNALELFRQQLGVPPTMQTPEEAEKLPPGTIFFDPDGTLRQVPGSQ